MRHLLVRFFVEEQAQDLIEYVLIASFVSTGALAGATALGQNLDGWYNAAATWVSTTSTTAFAP